MVHHHSTHSVQYKTLFRVFAASAGAMVVLLSLLFISGCTTQPSEYRNQQMPVSEQQEEFQEPFSQDWQTYVPTDIHALQLFQHTANIALPDAPQTARVVQPLQPITLTIQLARYTGVGELHLYDSVKQLANMIPLTFSQGLATSVVLPRGTPGRQCAIVLVENQLASANCQLFILDPMTEIVTGQSDIDVIYPMVHQMMQHDVVSYTLNDTLVRGYRSPDNPLLWLRDHVYQGRSFRYFEKDVTSLLDAFRNAQYPDGSFPDVLSYPKLGVKAHRLDTESDLEYLFVQGVYEAWQATGDDEWLLSQIPAMKRGIAYITSDPLRWDKQLGLVRRPYTIDTWDFQYGPTTLSPDGKSSPRHWIDDQTIWGIFHGDNTGLAYALKLLQRIETYQGHAQKARALHTQRDELMQRLNELSWNGPYYSHFIMLDGSVPNIPGVDTAAQLSLSNAYALNREILAFEQGRAIVETYHKRRDFSQAFAEWYSIDPPFPEGSFGMAGGKGEKPGEYVNGGIMPLVGGELARGAFTFGAEPYGFDILQRYAQLLKLTGSSYLWYYPDGRPGISSQHTLATDGWGSSAMLAALIEGAAGIQDKSSRFQELSLKPRWSALPSIQQAYVVVRYAASDGYVAYRWHYDTSQRHLSLDLTGTWTNANVRLLLPPDGRDAQSYTLLVDGENLPFSKRAVGSGYYIIFDVEGGNATIQLSWSE